MSLNSERVEIDGIVNRLLDNLAALVAPRGTAGAELRKQIGIVRARYLFMIQDGTFGDQLLKCFTLAQEANVALLSLAVVHNALFEEMPEGAISTEIVAMATSFCLATESQMIAVIEYTSRDDVEAEIARMKLAFDQAREIAADQLQSMPYRALTQLAGALTNHLATAARPLPRMVLFQFPESLPALALSQRLYRTGERWDELVDENKTIHPLFPQRIIRGLSI